MKLPRPRAILIPVLLAILFPCGPARSQPQLQERFTIESVQNHEYFVIYREKFRAVTYCAGWRPGQRVMFLEGSPVGGPTEVRLYNLDDRSTCRLRHER
jgi:hypothetical protein